MVNEKPEIVIPIEIHQREYFAKLWLSCELATRGHTVYIGDITATDYCFNDLKPDIYLSNLGRIDRDSNLENSLFMAVLDAEGGIFRSIEDYAARLKSRKFEFIDVFFVWGKPQAKLLRDLGYEGDVVVTGNPRFHLIRSDLKHIIHDPVNTGNQPRVVIITNDVRNTSPAFRSNIQKIIEEFVDYEFILRPHPSENWNKYAQMGKRFANLSIEPKGHALKYTLSADAVIHQNSTAGLEACVSGILTISHDPDGRTSDYKLRTPREISYIADSFEDLRKALRNELNCDSEQRGHESELDYIDLNVDSVQKIARYFDQVEIPRMENINQTIPVQFKLYHLMNALFPPKVMYLFRYLLTSLGLTNSTNRFPYLSTEEVKNHTDAIARQANYDIPVQVTHVEGYEALFMIRKVE
jgi:hypothetical protein